ncbi:ferredoxin [Ignicoccus hospitalis]|uniref:Ferredoxin n=1 Tax=Ignicoccus hospitalis (strain KIN4/I / DSM 18386 / JCM 14125) TaxID=453591 RepID=A8A8X1_IGNH4|nr:ferredoxin [Ignicoccus hospitalis]ABU81373.1 Ferredoxin-like protein [Ignicoccus hospitalis KIN4/I]HIH90323.1 ferredoxin [Desulfurococcaceae archaeon]
MAKYKVWIENEKCISDAVCAHLCPDVFEMNEEYKAVIVPQYRTGDNPAEGVIPEELKDCAEQAAAACPVQIIHVEPLQE